MDSSFNIERISHSAFDRLVFSGTIDARAEKEMSGAPELVRQSMVKIDFSNAGRINSMGIALLLRCFKTIRNDKKADIRVTGLSEVNKMLFRMTGVFLIAPPEL